MRACRTIFGCFCFQVFAFVAASGGGSVVCRAWYSSLRSSNLSKFGLESPMLSIYIYVKRQHCPTHIRVQFQHVTGCSWQHFGSTGLEPGLSPTAQSKQCAQQQLQQSDSIAALKLFMVAERWSWKHPGELQQAEGLIPEHWGTLNNSWSNKG